MRLLYPFYLVLQGLTDVIGPNRRECGLTGSLCTKNVQCAYYSAYEWHRRSRDSHRGNVHRHHLFGTLDVHLFQPTRTRIRTSTRIALSRAQLFTCDNSHLPACGRRPRADVDAATPTRRRTLAAYKLAVWPASKTRKRVKGSRVVGESDSKSVGRTGDLAYSPSSEKDVDYLMVYLVCSHSTIPDLTLFLACRDPRRVAYGLGRGALATGSCVLHLQSIISEDTGSTPLSAHALAYASHDAIRPELRLNGTHIGIVDDWTSNRRRTRVACDCTASIRFYRELRSGEQASLCSASRSDQRGQ